MSEKVANQGSLAKRAVINPDQFGLLVLARSSVRACLAERPSFPTWLFVSGSAYSVSILSTRSLRSTSTTGSGLFSSGRASQASSVSWRSTIFGGGLRASLAFAWLCHVAMPEIFAFEKPNRACTSAIWASGLAARYSPIRRFRCSFQAVIFRRRWVDMPSASAASFSSAVGLASSQWVSPVSAVSSPGPFARETGQAGSFSSTPSSVASGFETSTVAPLAAGVPLG